MPTFEFVSHTADIAIRIGGDDLADLLRAAALGVSAAIAGREELAPHRVPGAVPRAIEADDAPDDEGLLVNFLNEIIFQGEVNGEVYSDVEILSCDPAQGVRALAYPDPDLPALHAVKAATYYDLKIERAAGRLEATVVCDV